MIRTLDWIVQSGNNGNPLIEPKKNDTGVYECVITIPIVKKTVIGIGDSKIESIDNATSQSSKLIDEYLKNNPGFAVKNTINNANCILEEDDNGFLNIRLKKEENRC